MRSPLALPALLVAVTWSGAARTGPVTRPIASAEFREMRSVERGRELYRAAVGQTRERFVLVVERFGRERGGKGRALIEAHRFHSISMAGREVSLARVTAVESMAWSRGGLAFDADLVGEKLRCRLAVDPMARLPACDRSASAGAKAAATDWGSDVQVVRACERAFAGPRQRGSCLRAARSARTHPAALIAACELAFSGNDNELACIEAATSRIDGARRLAECERSRTGDAEELACLQAE